MSGDKDDQGDRSNKSGPQPFADTVVLVCKDCRKRSSGPDKIKAKELAKEARRSLGAQRPRPRVVLTSCLGLCPKRATAVARVGAAGSAVLAVTTLDDVAQLMASAAAD